MIRSDCGKSPPGRQAVWRGVAAKGPNQASRTNAEECGHGNGRNSPAPIPLPHQFNSERRSVWAGRPRSAPGWDSRPACHGNGGLGAKAHGVRWQAQRDTAFPTRVPPGPMAVHAFPRKRRRRCALPAHSKAPTRPTGMSPFRSHRQLVHPGSTSAACRAVTATSDRTRRGGRRSESGHFTIGDCSMPVRWAPSTPIPARLPPTKIVAIDPGRQTGTDATDFMLK